MAIFLLRTSTEDSYHLGTLLGGIGDEHLIKLEKTAFALGLEDARQAVENELKRRGVVSHVPGEPTAEESANLEFIWEYKVRKDGTCAIVSWNGSAGGVVIPETLGGMPVTASGAKAFSPCAWKCKNERARDRVLKSVQIPEGVTKIGPGVFEACGSLRELDVPGSVTTIGNQAFSAVGVDGPPAKLTLRNKKPVKAALFEWSLFNEIRIPGPIRGEAQYGFEAKKVLLHKSMTKKHREETIKVLERALKNRDVKYGEWE